MLKTASYRTLRRSLSEIQEQTSPELYLKVIPKGTSISPQCSRRKASPLPRQRSEGNSKVISPEEPAARGMAKCSDRPEFSFQHIQAHSCLSLQPHGTQHPLLTSLGTSTHMWICTCICAHMDKSKQNKNKMNLFK